MKNPFRLIVPAFLILLTIHSNAQERMMFVKNDKNPGIAFSLSLFTPGVGQMYNDQVFLGLGVFFGTMALYGGGAVLYQNTGSYDYYRRSYRGGTETLGAGMIIAGGLVHLGSLIYAPIKARQINRSNGDTAFLERKRKSELGFGITSTGGAGLTLAF